MSITTDLHVQETGLAVERHCTCLSQTRKRPAGAHAGLGGCIHRTNSGCVGRFSAASDLAGADPGQCFYHGGSHSTTATGFVGSYSLIFVLSALVTGEYILDCRFGIVVDVEIQLHRVRTEVA